MDANEPGAFRVWLGRLFIVIGLVIAAVEITAALYAGSTVTGPDRSWSGVTLFTIPLSLTLVLAGVFIEVSAWEWRHHSKRVEAQDEAPHGPRPGW